MAEEEEQCLTKEQRNTASQRETASDHAKENVFRATDALATDVELKLCGIRHWISISAFDPDCLKIPYAVRSADRRDMQHDTSKRISGWSFYG